MSLPSSSPALTSLSATDLIKLKHFITDSLTRELENENPPYDQRQAFIKQKLTDIFGRLPAQLPESIRQQLTQDVTNDVLGYGPIQPLLDDPDVTEIMVNGPKSVYVEKGGHLSKTGVTFENNQEVMRVIERIILPLGRRVDADTPTVDARLPDGSRVNAVIPPVAIDGASITIRKFRKDKLSIGQLIEFGSLTAPMAEFLRACVVSRLNIVVSGGTGSGKTTLLNVLSSMIPEEERIVTIEDAAELQLQQDHVVRLETRPTSLEGKGMVTIRDLVRNALRMRPDRIIVGECRGGETLDMLQAMNTGHDGSLTTLHANTPRDSLSRMETMVMMAGMEMPIKVIRQQVSSAIDLIVQQTRLRDGQRKITAITEVAGMEGDTIVLTDIFRFEQTGITTDGKVLGQVKPTGIRPLFGPRLEASGFKLAGELFGANLGDILKRR
jgi:pilus assembly protein CpaF